MEMSKTLPKIDVAENGTKIRTKEEWETVRRPEIIRLFEKNVYGVRPFERPENLTFSAEILNENLPCIQKKVTFFCGDFSFFAHLFLPKNKENIPVFLYVMHEYQEDNSDLEHDPLSCPFVPIETIVNRGYGVFIMPTRSIYLDFDHHAEYKCGVFTLEKKPRTDESWATISAWSWGLSRLADYIEENEPAADKSRLASIGHSRGGKTALWCGATDPRISYVISNDSGCSGAAVTRGKQGEHIKDITRMTDWFCENYRKYANNEDALPVDQHELLACIAPRLLYVASSSEDLWADPEAERLSCRLAGTAYEYYGKKGVVLPPEPVEIDKAYHEGTIGYHVKSGEHCITETDWKYYLDFADEKWK